MLTSKLTGLAKAFKRTFHISRVNKDSTRIAATTATPAKQPSTAGPTTTTMPKNNVLSKKRKNKYKSERAGDDKGRPVRKAKKTIATALQAPILAVAASAMVPSIIILVNEPSAQDAEVSETQSISTRSSDAMTFTAVDLPTPSVFIELTPPSDSDSLRSDNGHASLCGRISRASFVSYTPSVNSRASVAQYHQCNDDSCPVGCFVVTSARRLSRIGPSDSLPVAISTPTPSSTSPSFVEAALHPAAPPTIKRFGFVGSLHTEVVQGMAGTRSSGMGSLWGMPNGTFVVDGASDDALSSLSSSGVAKSVEVEVVDDVREDDEGEVEGAVDGGGELGTGENDGEDLESVDRESYMAAGGCDALEAPEFAPTDPLLLAKVASGEDEEEDPKADVLSVGAVENLEFTPTSLDFQEGNPPSYDHNSAPTPLPSDSHPSPDQSDVSPCSFNQSSAEPHYKPYPYHTTCDTPFFDAEHDRIYLYPTPQPLIQEPPTKADEAEGLEDDIILDDETLMRECLDLLGCQHDNVDIMLDEPGTELSFFQPAPDPATSLDEQLGLIHRYTSEDDIDTDSSDYPAVCSFTLANGLTYSLQPRVGDDELGATLGAEDWGEKIKRKYLQKKQKKGVTKRFPPERPIRNHRTLVRDCPPHMRRALMGKVEVVEAEASRTDVFEEDTKLVALDTPPPYESPRASAFGATKNSARSTRVVSFLPPPSPSAPSFIPGLPHTTMAATNRASQGSDLLKSRWSTCTTAFYGSDLGASSEHDGEAGGDQDSTKAFFGRDGSEFDEDWDGSSLSSFDDDDDVENDGDWAMGRRRSTGTLSMALPVSFSVHNLSTGEVGSEVSEARRTKSLKRGSGGRILEV